MIRRFAGFSLILLLMFLGWVRTTGQAAVSQEHLDTTAYVVDTPTQTATENPYGGPATNTPSPNQGTSSPTPVTQTPAKSATLGVSLTPTASPRPGSTTLATSTAGTSSPTSETTVTPGPSPTTGRDLFGTENAELANSRVTPPPSETPAPSPTLTFTSSPTATLTPPTGFLFDPNWFLGGLVFTLAGFLAVWLVIRTRRSGEFG